MSLVRMNVLRMLDAIFVALFFRPDFGEFAAFEFVNFGDGSYCHNYSGA